MRRFFFYAQKKKINPIGLNPNQFRSSFQNSAFFMRLNADGFNFGKFFKN